VGQVSDMLNTLNVSGTSLRYA